MSEPLHGLIHLLQLATTAAQADDGYPHAASSAERYSDSIQGGLHDELAPSLGADLLFAPATLGAVGYDGSGYAVPIAALQWNLYVGDRWSIFPEAGIALHYGFDDGSWSDATGHSYASIYLEPNLGVGGRYNFSPRVALLMRLSTPGGLQLGLNF